MWGTDWKGKPVAGAAAVQPVLGSNRWLLHWKAFLPPWQTPTETEKLISSSHNPDDSERCLHHNAEQKSMLEPSSPTMIPLMLQFQDNIIFTYVQKRVLKNKCQADNSGERIRRGCPFFPL